MDNIENAGQAVETADQQDAFMQGFGADDASETEQAADQQTGQESEDTAQAESTGTPEQEAGGAESGQPEAAEPETTGTEQGQETAPQQQEQTAPAKTWQIKHMGETRSFGVEDITPELLQKGMDYDRIRGKYDEAKPVVEMFSEFARRAGMSLADYAKHIRTQAKQAGGMSEAEAKRTVELEEREAAVAAKEAQRQEATDAKTARAARIRADLTEFEKAFPDVFKQAKSDPKAIPESVWKDVQGGLSLTAAYARYTVNAANAAAQEAQQKAAAAAQTQKNAARSTGSMRSAGNDAKNKDAFLEGFNS